MTLLAFAAEQHRLIAIRYLLLLSINGRQMDGQTGGRTLHRFIDPARQCHCQ